MGPKSLLAFLISDSSDPAEQSGTRALWPCPQALRAAPTPAPCPDPRESSGRHGPRNRRHGLKISQAGVRVGTFCSQWDRGRGWGWGSGAFGSSKWMGAPRRGCSPWCGAPGGLCCWDGFVYPFLFASLQISMVFVCLLFFPSLAARQQHTTRLGSLCGRETEAGVKGKQSPVSRPSFNFPSWMQFQVLPVLPQTHVSEPNASPGWQPHGDGGDGGRLGADCPPAPCRLLAASCWGICCSPLHPPLLGRGYLRSISACCRTP